MPQNAPGPPAPRRRRLLTEAEQRDVLGRLVTRTTKLDEEEVALLYDIYPYIFTTHHPAVWALVARPGLSKEQAKDVMQEIFIELFQCLLDGFPRSLPALITTIAKRRRSNRRRDSARHQAADPLPSSQSESPKSSGPDIERLLDLKEFNEQILPRLTPEHREVIEAYYVDDLSHAEAAEALGLSEGTFKSRLLAAKRAVAELAQYLPLSERAA